MADEQPPHHPQQHPRISPAELEYIRAHSAPAGEPGTAPPISTFLKHPAVWAIMVAHFCNNWSLYMLLTWLPTFVNKGLGVNFASVGVFTMFPHIAYFIFLNVAGNVADRLIRGGMEVGRVRKLMQTIGFGGVATALLIVGHVHSAPMAIAIMTLGNGIFAFTAGGFFVNHMDIAPRSAGTLMGITNTDRDHSRHHRRLRQRPDSRCNRLVGDRVRRRGRHCAVRPRLLSDLRQRQARV